SRPGPSGRKTAAALRSRVPRLPASRWSAYRFRRRPWSEPRTSKSRWRSFPRRVSVPSPSTNMHFTASSSLGCGSPSKRPDAGTGDRSRASYVRAESLPRGELDRQQDGHVVLPRRWRTASPERSRHKPHVLLPRLMNPKRTLCDHKNPAESIDETNEQGPKGLIAARARRCSTCGVVSGFFDEQVPPPLITWCCRAALFPG